MGKFSDTYDLPILKQEDLNNLNRPTAMNKIETKNKLS